jgi:stearoyl-CoA desaturase (delta-9 desaturase)
MSASIAAKPQSLSLERINYVKSLPFFGLHLACLLAFVTGVSWKAVLLCLSLYIIRMFGITAGYHRYFSHKTYQTSRSFQFILAWLGCSALQKGPLWWASHHRRHHQHSDQEDDVHSPEHKGFWWSHIGWILSSKYETTDYKIIKDFSRYPELYWLNRFHVIPGILLGVGCLLFGGWQGLVWGFFISTVLLYHGTFVINSLCHMFGTRRYATTDTSRNSLLLAILTLGEGWHNNHHYYATSANQGFFWWELDISYYALRLFSLFHLVWDLKITPQHVLDAAKG